jgi:hypothetical protein
MSGNSRVVSFPSPPDQVFALEPNLATLAALAAQNINIMISKSEEEKTEIEYIHINNLLMFFRKTLAKIPHEFEKNKRRFIDNVGLALFVGVYSSAYKVPLTTAADITKAIKTVINDLESVGLEDKTNEKTLQKLLNFCITLCWQSLVYRAAITAVR